MYMRAGLLGCGGIPGPLAPRRGGPRPIFSIWLFFGPFSRRFRPCQTPRTPGPPRTLPEASQGPPGVLGASLFKARFINFGSQRLSNFGGMRPCLPATMMQHATCVLRLSAYIVRSSNTTHTTLQSREASTSAACGSTLPMRPCKPKDSV